MGTTDNQVSRAVETQPVETSLALIEEQADRTIRREWHAGRWFFAIVDVIAVLTDSAAPLQYWRDTKRRMCEGEGWNETQENILPLRLRAADGKMRQTECTDTETLLRIIQSVPSPKAEPVKLWLARVGAQQLNTVTRPLDSEQVSMEIAATRKPAPDAPALAWAEYHEQLAALYRRQAAYETRLAFVDARLAEQDARLAAHDEQIGEHDAQIGELHSRMESLEEGQHMLADLPELLERLGPRTLSSEHQATVKHMANRLHEVSGFGYSTIYGELNAAFHVGRYGDIPGDRWPDVMAWFKTRIETAERKPRHPGD